jgi:hypothetical protein
MSHNTHGFEEEVNEHDVQDKVYNDIKPRLDPSPWVRSLKDYAGAEAKTQCTEHFAWQAAEYIEKLESELMAYRTNANLFEAGEFTSHAGLKLAWKIECDAIRPEEWLTLAQMIREYEAQPWSRAVGIPRGGVALGRALDKYSTGNPNDPVLIADDVYTTGTSFREYKAEFYADTATLQWCVFARNPTAGRTKALFTMPAKGRHGSHWDKTEY